MQALASTVGRKSRLTKDSASGYYNLSVMDRPCSRGGALTMTKEQYNGDVVCLSVPSSFVLIRSGGVTLVCGQSVNFGIVYGLTAKGLQAQLALSGIYWTEEQCQDFIDKWFAVFTGVHPYMKQQEYRALTYGYNWDLWGRVRWYPGIHSVHRRVVAEALREAGNMPIQASSAGLTKYTMALMDERDRTLYVNGLNFNPLLTIHDEVIYEAEEEIAEDLLALNLGLMSSAIELRVPVAADGKVKERW